LIRLFQDIIDSGAVVCASGHHTGTWFALNFLLGLDGFDRVVELRDMIDGKEEPDNNSIVHFHLTGETIHSRGQVECVGFEHAKELLAEVQSIVPLRDPMSSVISRNQRHPGMAHFFILDAFMFMDQLPERCFFLPVDLHQPARLYEMYSDYGMENRSYAARRDKLMEACVYLGETFNEHVHRYAFDWPSSNTRGEYALKVLYEKHQDLQGVRRFFPCEYDYLIQNGSRIIPFLKSKGYEYLPWFKECVL